MTETSIQFKTAFGLVCITTLAVGALELLAVVAANPRQIGPIGVTGWFIGLMLTLAGMVTLILFGLKSRLRPEDSKMARLSSSWRQGMLVGGGVTICLALQSLRQLGLRDIILIVVLGGLIEFYFRTRRQ